MATSARLEELQQKFNENPRRYFAPLANEHRKLGDLEQAITLCRTHLPQQPQHVSGHIVLAQALFEAGNTPDARQSFELALDLDPENLIALRFLGDIAREQGDHATARQWYERVLDADPRNDEIARLVRELENGAAAAAPAVEEHGDEDVAEDVALHTPAVTEPEPHAAFVPNDALVDDETPLKLPEPLEDLATAWQHEVAALDSPNQSEAAEFVVNETPASVEALELAREPQREPFAETFESVAEMPEPGGDVAESALEPVLAASTEDVAAPEAASEPNESWAEPDEEFVASVPTVESAAPPAPPAFTEIDYSMFEAVADEDGGVAPTFEQTNVVEALEQAEVAEAFEQAEVAEAFEQAEVAEAFEQAEVAEAFDQTDVEEVFEQAEVEEAFEQPNVAAAFEVPDVTPAFDAPDVAPAFEATDVARASEASDIAQPEESVVAEAPHTHGDDWFAMPSGREAEAIAIEPPTEASFDLDAAFQSVLPNQEPEELEAPVPQALTDFDEVPHSREWEVPATDTPIAGSETFSLQPDAPDSVDDAFAELDRLTASLEADVSGSAMLLPDEEYTASGQVEPAHHFDASIARTPDSGIPAVEPQPLAFVTETMAELYLQQGFRDEALAVYRQLLTMNPSDTVLAARVNALEGTDAAATPSEEPAPYEEAFRPASPVHADPVGQSMRAFLGVFARRRAPMRRREPVRASARGAGEQPQTSGLSALFGSSSGADDGAAAVLAGAFVQPNADSEALPGRPTRAAAQELSLGDVFGGGAAASSGRAASFDEFFSTGSANESVPSPLDEEGSDMEQFTAWLEGLKKK